MTVVLATPPFLAFYDNDGNPLSGGLVYTYAAGTTTPKATFTDSTGATPMSNPIVLDSSGRATWWISGAYKYVVKDSLGNTIKTTDNVTSFSTLADAADAFFQTFSGTGSQTAFTLSTDQGTDPKALMIFIDRGLQSCVTNGTFATDTGWTKGAGWTIGAGVATAAGAISTAISQTSPTTLVEGQAYAVKYTITRSAGGLIPSIGGNNGVERTASGTYTEIIIAGSTQTTAFTGNGFTGTLDTVTITPAVDAGYDIIAPTAYTVSGTALTFTTAPATGTNNIYVFAPSSLVGAASSAAAAAEASATAALASEVAAAASAASAAAFSAAKNQWTFSTTTTMSDPSTANIRFNNATLASVTQIAISDLSANAGNPDLTGWIDTWDDAGGSNSGSIFIFKDNSNFAIYNVNSALTDNTTWHQVPVTHVASTGSFSNSDELFIGFAASGTTTVTGGITDLTGDVTASGSGSVAATVANVSVIDTNLAIKGSSDATKIVKFEVDGLTTATTRTLTVPDANGTIALTSDIPAASPLQVVSTTYATNTTLSTALPYDDTIPQNTEGTEIMTLAITPESASSKLIIEYDIYASTSGAGVQMAAALFVDSTAGALDAVWQYAQAANNPYAIRGSYVVTSGSTSARTYKVRLGANSGSVFPNGSAGSTRIGGGVLACKLRITEIG